MIDAGQEDLALALLKEHLPRREQNDFCRASGSGSGFCKLNYSKLLTNVVPYKRIRQMFCLIKEFAHLSPSSLSGTASTRTVCDQRFCFD
jgi:hypothetical protein